MFSVVVLTVVGTALLFYGVGAPYLKSMSQLLARFALFVHFAIFRCLFFAVHSSLFVTDLNKKGRRLHAGAALVFTLSFCVGSP